jgi:hypothetical protein
MRAVRAAFTSEKLAQELINQARRSIEPNEAAKLLARAAVWQQLAKSRIPNEIKEFYFPARRSARRTG